MTDNEASRLVNQSKTPVKLTILVSYSAVGFNYEAHVFSVYRTLFSIFNYQQRMIQFCWLFKSLFVVQFCCCYPHQTFSLKESKMFSSKIEFLSTRFKFSLISNQRLATLFSESWPV